jgi:hypothetical protein
MTIRLDVTAELIPASGPKRPAKQVCYGHFCGKDGKPLPHPQQVLLPIWDGQQPYPVGTYTLAPQSFYPDKWRELALSPKLVAVATR